MKTCSSPLPRAVRAVLGLAAFVAATVAFAGPPMICRSYDIADAKTLPGGSGAHDMSPSYDRSHLVGDTLALLTPDTPILVRMETLRRAAVYATNGMRDWDKGSYPKEDRALANSLLENLRTRAAQTQGEARTLAIFDVGFFAETLRQTRMDPNLDGYSLIAQAASFRPKDAEIMFALALASINPQRKEHTEHLARARAAAQPGSLLAVNIKSHFGSSS